MRIFARGFNMFCEMKKVLFIFAALIALAACGNKQAATPQTESSEVSNEVVTNDTISPEMKESNIPRCLRRTRYP